GSLFEGFFGVGHDQFLIENHFLAQPVTNRTGAGRSIEGEMFGGEWLVTLAGGRAQVPIRVQSLDPARGQCNVRGVKRRKLPMFLLHLRYSSLFRNFGLLIFDLGWSLVRLVQRQDYALTPLKRDFDRVTEPDADLFVN